MDYNDSNQKSKNIFIFIPVILSILIIIYIIYIAFYKETNDQFAPFAIFGIPVYVSIIWGIYGIWLFIRIKVFKNERFSSILSLILICLIIAIIPIIMNLINNIGNKFTYGYLQSKREIPNTVSSLMGKCVYINENSKPTPYIVVDNNYGYEKNSLLVRKNVLNDKINYVDDYNRTVVNINERIGVSAIMVYKESEVDKYLLSEQWLNRFDETFLNNINNTNLLCMYNDAEKGNNYIRKFFIPSQYDVVFGYLTKAEKEYLYHIGNQYLTYLDKELNESTIYDDNGNIVKHYWQRRDYSINQIEDENRRSSYYDDIDVIDNNHEPSYIRPSFTVPNNTKVREITDDKLGNIYKFDF